MKFLNLKHRLHLFILPLLIVFSSCRHDKNDIRIKGDVKGLAAKRVYLYFTYPINSPAIDSTTVSNGKFEFHIHTDTPFEPQMVHIGYQNSNGKTDLLGINNLYPRNKDKPDVWADFYMEPGLTNLSGDRAKSKYAGLTIEAGPQNDFYFRNIWLPFTRVSKIPAQHLAFIASLKSLVRNNPGAFPAMFALKNLGYGMTNAELKSVYDEFDEDVKNSRYGRETKFLLDNRSDDQDKKSNNQLTDTAGRLVDMIDTTKKLNMIVFWASWCGPCKQEIPSLKRIAAKFKNDNFKMVGVSIDVNKSQWRSALAQQQMPWQQLCVDHKDLNRLKAQYNLNAIPQVYFINKKGQMVGKSIGFDTLNETKFEKIIAANLK